MPGPAIVARRERRGKDGRHTLSVCTHAGLPCAASLGWRAQRGHPCTSAWSTIESRRIGRLVRNPLIGMDNRPGVGGVFALARIIIAVRSASRARAKHRSRLSEPSGWSLPIVNMSARIRRRCARLPLPGSESSSAPSSRRMAIQHCSARALQPIGSRSVMCPAGCLEGGKIGQHG